MKQMCKKKPRLQTTVRHLGLESYIGHTQGWLKLMALYIVGTGNYERHRLLPRGYPPFVHLYITVMQGHVGTVAVNERHIVGGQNVYYIMCSHDNDRPYRTCMLKAFLV